jgi:hypothetical protein
MAAPGPQNWRGPSDTEIPLRDRIARTLIRNAVADELNNNSLRGVPGLIPGLPTGPFDPHNLPDAPSFEQPADGDVPTIGIVGAGVAGLFIAAMFDFLNGIEIYNIKPFNIKYEILESSPRAGGRILTKFLNSTPHGSHDYFDVGAMRFPKIPILDLTFFLFQYYNIKLVPYYLSGKNNPLLYNGRYWKDATQPPPDKDDYFKVSVKNKGTVPDELSTHLTVLQCLGRYLIARLAETN